MKKSVILVDYCLNGKQENPFVEELENVAGGEWIVKEKSTNRLLGGRLLNVVRFLWYFLFPLQIVAQRHDYDKIIGWQQFYALNYAFFCRLFALKKVNDVTVMTFIYRKKEGLVGKLYHRYMNYIVTSKYIDRFICFAKEECEYYSNVFNVAKEKFIFVPLGCKMAKADIKDDRTVFSAGRSNRDYDFLIDLMKTFQTRVIIACDSYRRKDIPSNIEILNDCYGQDMVGLMAKSHCVVVPLQDLKVSSGQLVVLQAMSLGKPVICTKSDGIKDYVVDGETGFLVDNTRKEWFDALEKMYKDKCYYDRMSKAAFELYQKEFTEKAMYRRIAEVVRLNRP